MDGIQVFLDLSLSFCLESSQKPRLSPFRLQRLEDQIAFFRKAGFDYVTQIAGFYAGFGDTEGITTNQETARTAVGEDRTRQWAQEHEGIINNLVAFEKYRWPSADDFDYTIWDTYDNILPTGMKAIAMLGKIYTPAWMLMVSSRSPESTT